MAKKDVTKPITLDPRGGRPRDKCVTYIEGIDRILNGGIPIGNITLLAGTVGSGKTTLAMEFLINGAKAGETCCYISVTEPSSKMLSNLQTYGFFDDALVKEGKLNIFDLTVINDRLGVERLDGTYTAKDMEALLGAFEDIVDTEEKRWTSIGFMIMLFIATVIIAKTWKIRIQNRKKYVTTGIGSFVFLYLFSWIVSYTIIHVGTSSSVIPFP